MLIFIHKKAWKNVEDVRNNYNRFIIYYGYFLFLNIIKK